MGLRLVALLVLLSAVAAFAGEEKPATLEGKVVNPKGKCPPGAEIRLVRAEEPFPSFTWHELDEQPPLKVKEEGGFRVEDLTPGCWFVVASAPGLKTRFERIHLAAGQQKTGLVLHLEPGLSISGRVVSAKGEPIDGVDLEVSSHIGMWAIGGPDGWRTEFDAETDANGRFTVAGLPADTYRIRSSHFRHVEATVEEIDAGRADVEIVLEPGLRIAGRVLYPDGTKAAGLVVNVAEGPYPVTAADTDEEGRFETLSILRGKYTLFVVPPALDMEPPEAPSFRRTEVENVEAGTLDVVVKLLAGASIAGIVVDEAGKPVGGALIYVTDTSWNPVAMGEADREGRFEVKGLPPDGKLAVKAIDTERHRRSTPITVKPGDKDVRLVLREVH